MAATIYITPQAASDVSFARSYIKNDSGTAKLYVYLPFLVYTRSVLRRIASYFDQSLINESIYTEWVSRVTAGTAAGEYEIPDTIGLPTRGEIYEAIQDVPNVSGAVSPSDTIAQMAAALLVEGYLIEFDNKELLANNTRVTMGYINYQDTSTAAGLALSASTWTQIPNDGAGSESTSEYAPTGVSDLLDTSNGTLIVSDLNNGDQLNITQDFTINPSINNTLVEVRLVVATSGVSRTLIIHQERLDNGAGVAYQISPKNYRLPFLTDDDLTTNVKLEVRVSNAATLINNSITLSPTIRNGIN